MRCPWMTSKPTHGKTVAVDVSGTLDTKATGVKYQWYLDGKAVTGATKSTYRVPQSAEGKTLSVAVTGSYKNISFGVQSLTSVVK